MKSIRVTVPWEEGLHLRPAAEVVKRARSFRSTIRLKTGGRFADARSILSIMLLAASFGMVVNIEVSGEDEALAVQSISAVFDSDQADVDEDQIN